ncbi:MAG TPA: protein TolR [Gammaproteobacteria bacterium]|nr:protein TolR [Gammaproteobacteria bacterium]
MSRKNGKRRMMGEINVVPYIDVMLVLLIIFMITAPMLTPGVVVDLPNADASPLDSTEKSEPVVVTVDSEGLFYIDIGENPDQPVDAQTLQTLVAAVLKNDPGRKILLKGDEAAAYGQVVQVMVLLQQAGLPALNLITESAPDAADEGS